MKPAQGFTLIEVMVSVAIVAVLAAIALPNYSAYVVRGKLTEAHSQLSAMRVKLEQYYADNRTYVGACAPGTVAPKPGNNGAIDGSSIRYFNFSCVLAASSYTVTATGAGSTASFVFKIDQSNNRTTTGVPAGWTNPGNCWVTSKSGC